MDGKGGGSKKIDPYDGVVYESTRKLNAREALPPRKKKPVKNNMAAFYIITLVIAILLCMIVFAVVFQSMTGSRHQAAPPATAPPVVTSSESTAAKGDLTACMGVIQAIDGSGAWMDILNVSDNTTYHLMIKGNTNLQDKTGAPLLIGEFAPGEIVEAQYDAQTGGAALLNKSSNAWTFRERANIPVDTAAKTITIDNDVYAYNENLVTFYKGKPFSLDLIQPLDVLTITGVAKTAWCVAMVKGHGSLYISNAGNIANGSLEIDNNIYKQLGENHPIYLSEGAHHMVIKGDNIETYMQDIVIEGNKSQYLKLEDVIKIKTGWISVQVNIQDYRLIVDGAEQTPDQPLNLVYGPHTIRVEKDGYVPSEQTINVKSLASSIKMTLNPLLRLGKIIVTSEPTGAQVYVDSAYVGDTGATQVSVSIETGQHKLTVSKDGYMSITFSINVDSDAAPNTYHIELQPVLPQITENPPAPTEQATAPPADVPTETPPDTPAETEIPTPAQPGFQPGAYGTTTS